MMRAENARATVDGNAVAGLLSDVFAADATMMTGTCRHCGSSGPLAETIVELDEAAAIVRCRTCTRTLLTVLRSAQELRVTFGSLGDLRAPA